MAGLSGTFPVAWLPGAAVFAGMLLIRDFFVQLLATIYGKTVLCSVVCARQQGMCYDMQDLRAWQAPQCWMTCFV